MPHLLPLKLASRSPGLIHPRLDLLRSAAADLGHPQAAIPTFRIAGTNGKGSTAAMLEAVLAAHGLATGLYTSPHLVRVEERIRVRGRDVDRSTLEATLDLLEPYPELSFFETLTLAAWLIFREAGLDAVVLEVGLGGRWDATSIAPCAVAGLTNVGTDHGRWLGTDRHAIAREKAAALEGAEVAIAGPGVEDDLKPLRAGLDTVDAAALVALEPAGSRRVRADWGAGWVELELPLPGAHQRDNLHLALAMARATADLGLLPALHADAVRHGLAAVRWPGRLSVHTIAGREVLLDGAHNREGAASLARHLAGHDPPYNLLFSCLEDKPVEAMADLLVPVTGAVAVVGLATDRAMPLDRLRRAFPSAVAAASPPAALELLPDPVVAAGSLRLVGALLEYAGGRHGVSA